MNTTHRKRSRDKEEQLVDASDLKKKRLNTSKNDCEYQVQLFHILPIDVMLFIYEFLKIDITLYVKMQYLSERYRSYCKNNKVAPLLKVLYGYFRDDPQRKIHFLFKTIVFDVSSLDIYLSDSLKDDINPYSVITRYIGPVDHVFCTRLANNKGLCSLDCTSFSLRRVSERDLKPLFGKNLKELKILATATILDFLKERSTDFLCNLETLTLIGSYEHIDRETIETIFAIPTLKELDTEIDLSSIDISCNFCNENLRKLKVNGLNAANIREINKIFPNLQFLGTRINSVEQLDNILDYGIPRLELFLNCRLDETCFRQFGDKKFEMLYLDSIYGSRIVKKEALMNIAQSSSLKKIHWNLKLTMEDVDILFGKNSKLKLEEFAFNRYESHPLTAYIERIAGLHFHGVENYEMVLLRSQPRRVVTSESKFCFDKRISISALRKMVNRLKNCTEIIVRHKSFTDKHLNELIKAGIIKNLSGICIVNSSLSSDAIYYLCKQENLLFGDSRFY
jgi:hypothetical protein